MARQVLPWVGAAVGAYFGNPQLGFMIGSMLGNAVDPQVINGPKLGEGQDNTASEGGYRPIVLGKGAVGVCMIHEGPLKKRTIRHRQSKGGGPVTTEERRYRTMAFALGESANPDAGVALTRLWIDNKLRYDVTPTSQILQESMEFASQFTFYPGDETQEPDPDIEAFLGAGNVPSYRGGAPYIVLPNWDVTDSRGMAPMIKAELASIGGQSGRQTIAIGRITAPADRQAVIDSIDGDSWEILRDNMSDFANVVLAAVGNGYVAWNGHNAQGSVDGANWATPVGSFGGYGIQKRSFTRTSTLIIPGGSGNGVFRTTDLAASFQNHSNGGMWAVAVATRSDVSVCLLRGTKDTQRSVTDGVSWIAGGAHGIYEHADYALSCSDTMFVAGGQSSNVDPRPVLSRSASGAEWSAITLSSSLGYTIRAIVSDNRGAWVAITNNGEIWFSHDDAVTWEKSADALTGNPSGLVHNGSKFIASSNGFGAQIINSVSGESWSEPAYQLDTINLLASNVSKLTPIEGELVPLHALISWVHDRVNVPASKYDVAELSDLVEGVVFSDGYTATDAIRAAAGWYFFDAGEFDGGSGYRIHYVKRGKPAVATLTDQDIVEGPEDWEREDSYERPRVLHIAYQNPVADYGAPTVPIKRTSPDVLVVGERSINIPFVHSDQDEVARRGDIAMTVTYTEIAGKYEVVLPVNWLSLAPTDTIGFSIRGRTRRLRMTSWRYSPDGTIKTEWMADRQSAYTSDLTALPAAPSAPPPASIVGATVSAVLDIPALVDAMDSLHLVVAASGQTPAWHGSIHQRKMPSDSDFSTAAQFVAPTTIMGVLQGVVSQASQHYTDTTNVVRVKLYSDDELETYTQQQFLSEHGAFALAWNDGGVRRWEVCQYRDAVKVGDQEWELTTLARGRLNTDVEAHPAGSLFVLLDAGVRAMPMQSAMVGQYITHRAVSLGQLPDQAVPYTEPYTGESQREWPVAHLFLDRAGDDINCMTVPRHRFGTDDGPIRSANWTGYRWTATDGINTVTADTLVETHTFDVSGWASPVTVTVAQLNRITGAGPTVSEQVE